MTPVFRAAHHPSFAIVRRHPKRKRRRQCSGRLRSSSSFRANSPDGRTPNRRLRLSFFRPEAAATATRSSSPPRWRRTNLGRESRTGILTRSHRRPRRAVRFNDRVVQGADPLFFLLFREPASTNVAAARRSSPAVGVEGCPPRRPRLIGARPRNPAFTGKGSNHRRASASSGRRRDGCCRGPISVRLRRHPRARLLMHPLERLLARSQARGREELPSRTPAPSLLRRSQASASSPPTRIF